MRGRGGRRAGDEEAIVSRKGPNLHQITNLSLEEIVRDCPPWLVRVLCDVVREVREDGLLLTFLTPLVISFDEQIKVTNCAGVARDGSVWTNSITTAMLTIWCQ